MQQTPGIPFHVEAHPKWETQMVMSLNGMQARALAERLRPVLDERERGLEVRTALGEPTASHAEPGEWTLFWKLHESETRALLARPSREEWVATIILENRILERIIAGLESASAGDELSLSGLARLGRPTNLHLSIKIL